MSHKIVFKISGVPKVERNTFESVQEATDVLNAMVGGDIDIRHFTKDPESDTWTFGTYTLVIEEN